jgi:hypothetical protein
MRRREDCGRAARSAWTWIVGPCLVALLIGRFVFGVDGDRSLAQVFASGVVFVGAFFAVPFVGRRLQRRS